MMPLQQPSAATALTLQGSWQKDKTGSTAQFFPWSGVALPNPNGKLPTNRFIGDPNDRYDSERTSLGWILDHNFNDQWSFHQNVRFSRNAVDYFTLYGDSFTVPGGWAGDPVNQRLIGRFADYTQTDARIAAADQSLRGEFQTGEVRHKLLVGFDALRYRKQTHSFFDLPVYYPGGGVPLIDAYDPVYVPYKPGPLVRQPRSKLHQAGLYLQDQLYWGNWVFVAGLRYDSATNSLEGAADEHSSALPSGWA